MSKVTIGSGEPSDAGPAFPNQYAKIVGTATGTTDPQAALGPPDQQKAIVELAGSLVLDMGEGLDRVSDRPGPDLVVFQSDLDGIFVGTYETKDAEYMVEVAEDIDGPYFSLGINDASVDDRRLGDEFDLFTAGITSARFVRITPITEAVAIDAVLANHTHQAGNIRIEHFVSTPCTGCLIKECTPETYPVCFPFFAIQNAPVVGDLTGDGSPEIVVTVQSNPAQHETLVINGITKAEELRVTLPEASDSQAGNSASPAIGDINGDGQAEIVINSEAGTDLLVVKADGTEVFRVPAGNGRFVSPALENVDNDPYPEILWPGGFLQHDGTPGLADNALGINQPVAADLDADGNPELVIAHSEFGYVVALESDGTVLWQTPYRLIHNFRSLGGNSARPVVADLDFDGRPDLIFVGADDAQMNITVLDSLDGSIMWQKVFPRGGKASRPAIADINGDGEPEIVLFPRGASSDQYDYVIALDKNGNELWRSEALDPEGNPPSISAADLDGDGAAEVLWNGSISGFTIFDGKTGNVLYRNPLARSLSAFDYPVIADVDADGHLEVVTGSWDGLYIFGNDNGWGGGRKVWNQSDYRITNVNDDLSIPEVQPESWQLHNTYLFQEALPQDMPEASLTVEHKLGASVTFQPTDITPAPTQVSGQQVIWTQTFPATSGTTFTVAVDTPALQPGETLTISESTTINGTLTFIDGQVVNVSVPVGPVLVHAPHIIGIEPSARTVAAGNAGEFTVSLRNLRDVSETFTLEVLGVDPSSVSLASSVTLAPGEEVSLPLSITTSPTAPDSMIDFVVVAAGGQGTKDSAWARLEVTETTVPLVSGGGVHVELTPTNATVGQNTPTDFRVAVTNTGNQAQTFDLVATLPAGITGEFGSTSLSVAPGLSSSQETTLRLTAAQGTTPGDLNFSVTASATGEGGVAHTAEATLTVSGVGVQVQLLPETAVLSPEQTTLLQMTVTNTGSQQDTFNLSIGGSLGAFACLGSSSPCPEILPVSLAAGGSQVVDVTVSGLNGFLQQRTLVVAQATSATYPQIVATDASVIDIGAFRDVAATFEPTEVTVTSLEPAEYLLRVTNTGNACDERYTLEFSSTPSGVQLTPETTQFLVPPQKTAGIWVTAHPSTAGNFTVRARVIAQTDNPLCPALGAAENTAEALLIVDIAAVCGNGILEAGEACDDGNTQDRDCCSATCQIEPEDTICRPAVYSCDVAETCDGSSPICPSDQAEPDGTICNDNNMCTSGDLCSAGQCIGTPPGECLTILTTSGPCDVNGDGVVDESDNNAVPLKSEEAGNVCQELNALGEFFVTLVTPDEFAEMSAEQLASYDCIVLDTKPKNVTGLGTTWHGVIGIENGEGVFLTNHDVLWHSYYNRVVAPPDLPGDRLGPQTLIRDALNWVCMGTGLVVFNTPPDFVQDAGFTAIDSLPPEWGIIEDAVDPHLNALGTDILSSYEPHPIYGNVSDEQDPPCDSNGQPGLSTVPNSISSFPSEEYFSCPPSFSDHSYHQLFRDYNTSIFAQPEQAFSKVHNGDPFPDTFPSDGALIDGSAISLIREGYWLSLINAPGDPVPVDTAINVSADFHDSGYFDNLTAVWRWGDGESSPGTVVETEPGTWSISDTYTYRSPGVYTVELAVYNGDIAVESSVYQYVVVFDSSGGFVTGGGWIESPPGAFMADQFISGRANFGFISRYKKGTAIPTGETEFKFNAANLGFHSTTYDWLVVSGALAQYKGIGTINGEGEYKFVLTAIDADINNHDAITVDRFRIRIWTEDESGYEDVVYDNGLDADDLDDTATTQIRGGSIVIHKAKGK
jgi:cysteine-rich repeat protein